MDLEKLKAESLTLKKNRNNRHLNSPLFRKASMNPAG